MGDGDEEKRRPMDEGGTGVDHEGCHVPSWKTSNKVVGRYVCRTAETTSISVGKELST